MEFVKTILCPKDKFFADKQSHREHHRFSSNLHISKYFGCIWSQVRIPHRGELEAAVTYVGNIHLLEKVISSVC